MQTWSLYRLKEVLLKMMVFQAAEQIKAVQSSSMERKVSFQLLSELSVDY